MTFAIGQARSCAPSEVLKFAVIAILPLSSISKSFGLVECSAYSRRCHIPVCCHGLQRAAVYGRLGLNRLCTGKELACTEVYCVRYNS